MWEHRWRIIKHRLYVSLPSFKKKKKTSSTAQSNTRGMWNQKRQKSESVGSQPCDFVDVIQPFRAHVPSSVKWRLSQDQTEIFREQCFPDHPNKNTNLLIIHLCFSLFFSITTTFVYLGSQNKSPQIGWLKQQEFVSPLFWKLEVKISGFGFSEAWLPPSLRPQWPFLYVPGPWFLLVSISYFISLE